MRFFKGFVLGLSVLALLAWACAALLGSPWWVLVPVLLVLAYS